MSETQSQSVDGTEPVTQPEDVPLQLLLEDQRKRKKQEDFDKKMAAPLRKVLMFLDLFMRLRSQLGKTCRVAVMALLSLLRRKSRRPLRGRM